MKLHEYQAKEILGARSIAIPKGKVVDTFAAALVAVEELGLPLAIKAQLHLGGRGKAGAIKVVSSFKEFEREFLRISGMEVKGLKVRKVLLEEALSIKKQFYLGITVDRSKQTNAIVVSLEGGVEIEETARLYPEKIHSLLLAQSDRLSEEEVDRVTSSLRLPDFIIKSFKDIIRALFITYISIDSELSEINPFVLTEENRLVACDAKIIIDDNALFRHPDLEALKEEAEENELEKEAHRRGIAYVKLRGNIGIIGNGAGLVMATMDEIKRVGGSPANFLDIGGGAKQEVMQNALEIIYMDRELEGVFINIFGGITRCDEVAKSIIQVVKNAPRNIPVVLRLVGTQAQEGRRLLEKADLISVESMGEGAKKIVSLVGSKR